MMSTQLQSFLVHWTSPASMSARTTHSSIKTMFTIATNPKHSLLYPQIATSLHFPLLIILAFSIPLLIRLRTLILRDYASFISLGAGGTPQTPVGYLHITTLRLLARHNVHVAPTLTTSNSRPEPYFRTLGALPQRKHVRPRVAGIAPHRQIDQRGSPEDVRRLTEAMRDVARRNPGRVRMDTSCFEKHSQALFLVPDSHALTASASSPSSGGLATEASQDLERGTTNTRSTNTSTSISTTAAAAGAAVVNAASTAAATAAADIGVPWNRTCGAPPEIAHLHGSESSLHVTLDAADVRCVLERGWGERHPLAGRWLHSGFTMVHAPRDEVEVQIVMEIVRAAGWWVGGVKLR